MELVKEISKMLTDDCVISFSNGRVVKGAEDTARVIVQSCRAYNEGFIMGAVGKLAKGAVPTLVILGTGVWVYKTVNRRVKTIKE